MYRFPRGVPVLVVVAATAAALTACGTDTPPAPTAPAAPTAVAIPSAATDTAPPSASTDGLGISSEQAVQLVREHLEAVGRSDADAWAAALDPNVRFDIAGSIYQGRQAAREWGERDPIGQGGRYDILSLTPTMTGVTADVTFRAGSLVEQIRYQYTIRGGKIVDLIARYRQ